MKPEENSFKSFGSTRTNIDKTKRLSLCMAFCFWNLYPILFIHIPKCILQMLPHKAKLKKRELGLKRQSYAQVIL